VLNRNKRYARPDTKYPWVFHSPGVEPWILGFLKNRATLGKVHDVGCGYGFWGFLIKTYVGSHELLIGSDISRGKLTKAKTMSIYDDLVVADARRSPFRTESIDTIISVEALHGFINNSVLAALELTLKQGGLIVLTLPSSPRDFGASNLLCRGYDVYRYVWRGFFLLSLNSGEILLTYDTLAIKLLKMVLKLVLRIKRTIPYLIVSKVKV